MSRMNIIERLERIGRGENMDLADIVCADAKAEIERLRKRVKELETDTLSSAQPCHGGINGDVL